MNPALNVSLIKDVDGLQSVTSFLSRTPEFCLDLETNVTKSFFDRRIRTIQVGNRQEQYVIDLLPFAGSTEGLLNGMGGYRHAAWAQPVVDALRPYLEAATHLKIGHGLDFEYETLKWGLGLRIFNLYDTLLAEKVIYSGAVEFFKKDFWGLDDLTARYTGLKISKEEQKSFDLSTPLTWNQVVYAGLDARLPASIKGAQTPRIMSAGLEKAVQIENDAIPAITDMHLNGLLISEEKWNGLVDKTKEDIVGVIASLDELFIPIVGKATTPYSEAELGQIEERWRSCKDRDARAVYLKQFRASKSENTAYGKKAAKFEGQANVQYGSPDQLLHALKKAGYKIQSTNDEVLETLEGDPIIDAIREFRTSQKIINDYGPFLDKYVDKNTGRVHSSFNQLGAATGRLSSSKPNVQNINKESDWRECFVARPGYSVITVDYNGCELRILAESSQERIWIDAFNAGWDVHSVGAEIVFDERWKQAACKGGEKIVKKGKEIVLPPCEYYISHGKCECPGHKTLRNYIKAINFGIAYGMEAAKLARKLRITKQEAQRLLDDYRKAFPCVTKWLEKIGKEAKMNLMSRTLSGRYRLYDKPEWERAKEIARKRCEEKKKPFTGTDINRVYQAMYGAIEREGKNSPIQGTNADMVKLAVGCGAGYMWQRLESEFGAYLINIVHDEIVVEAKDENAEEVFKFIGDCMKRAGAEFLKSVVAEYDGHIKPFWSKEG